MLPAGEYQNAAEATAGRRCCLIFCAFIYNAYFLAEVGRVAYRSGTHLYHGEQNRRQNAAAAAEATNQSKGRRQAIGATGVCVTLQHVHGHNVCRSEKVKVVWEMQCGAVKRHGGARRLFLLPPSSACSPLNRYESCRHEVTWGYREGGSRGRERPAGRQACQLRACTADGGWGGLR